MTEEEKWERIQDKLPGGPDYEEDKEPVEMAYYDKIIKHINQMTKEASYWKKVLAFSGDKCYNEPTQKVRDIDIADGIIADIYPDRYRHVKYEYSTFKGDKHFMYSVYIEGFGLKSSNIDFVDAINKLIADGEVPEC